jgi:hypothetical protein
MLELFEFDSHPIAMTFAGDSESAIAGLRARAYPEHAHLQERAHVRDIDALSTADEQGSESHGSAV